MAIAENSFKRFKGLNKTDNHEGFGFFHPHQGD
jgi:hypothetical protein